MSNLKQWFKFNDVLLAVFALFKRDNLDTVRQAIISHSTQSPITSSRK